LIARHIADTVELSNGVKMPWLGLGTYKTPEGQSVVQSVRWALEAGYRHIDTAALYGNERGVGEAIRASGLRREEIFVTTKVWNDDVRRGYDAVLRAFDQSADRLGIGTIDLYLIHWPVPGKFKEAWRALERLYAEKRVRSIGVSNFQIHHLQEVLADAQVRPMVNQVEFHPWLAQPELLEFCRQQQIVVEAWAPMMQGRAGEVPELLSIGRRHGKTPAQVVLRWDLQKGVVTIPKSIRRERIVENAALFDFELSPDEMATIDKLNQHKRLGADPDHFTF
jgi:diketogulonate reductase-like aldo/keto reductase